MAEKLYKLIEQSTAGWNELGGKYVSLTKDQCDSYIQELVSAGVNPVSYTHLTLPTKA